MCRHMKYDDVRLWCIFSFLENISKIIMMLESENPVWSNYVLWFLITYTKSQYPCKESVKWILLNMSCCCYIVSKKVFIVVQYHFNSNNTLFNLAYYDYLL